MNDQKLNYNDVRRNEIVNNSALLMLKLLQLMSLIKNIFLLSIVDFFF